MLYIKAVRFIMRKLVPLVGILVIFLVTSTQAQTQVPRGKLSFRLGLSEETLYLEEDKNIPGRYRLMWSAWIIVDLQAPEWFQRLIPPDFKVVGESSLTPLGQWTMAPTSRFSLGDTEEKDRIGWGINALQLSFPLASIDLPEDMHGPHGPSFAALFDYNQVVKITIALRRKGYWTGVPPLVEKKFELRPLGYALLRAARTGDVRAAKALLDKGADADSATVYNWTALMEAASEGNRSVVRLLLESGAKVNAKRKGFPFVLSELGSAIPYGGTALMAACFHGDPGTVRLLINAGAKINLERMDRWTALLAASYGGHTEIVRMLLAKGARVRAETEKGYSARALADINGSGAVARSLAARGAEIRVPWDMLSH